MSFSLNPDECARFDAWRADHDATCPVALKQGAIGGRWTYCFTPTSLGTFTEVCCGCGAKVDVTAYEDL